MKREKQKRENEKAIRQRLLSKQTELLESLQRQLKERLAAESSVSPESAEFAVGVEDLEISSTLAEIESAQLNDIEEALQRLEEGTYGICEICGRPISKERLRILPFTTVCVHCKEQEEAEFGDRSQFAGSWSRVQDETDEETEFSIEEDVHTGGLPF